MHASLKKYAVAMAAVCAVSAAAHADDKWYDTLSIGGHVQSSYVGSLGKDTPQTNQLRGYDTAPGFNLNQAQIKISKPLGDDGWGFTTKLMTGKDAGVIHSSGLGSTSSTLTDSNGDTVTVSNSDSSFDLQEAYVQMGVSKIKGLSVTAGKFVTTAGVEVIESPLNMTIAPGFLFFYGMPFTHTGLKANYSVNDKLSVMAGVVNGWDNVTDNNSGKSILVQAASTLMPGLSVNFTGSYGPERFASNVSKRTFADLVVGFTAIPKVTLSAEALWGQDSNIGGVSDSGKGTWSAFGLWGGLALSDLINPGLRFEVFRDQNNAGRLGGANQTAKNFALVNKVVLTKNTFARVEYRHDWSNAASFTRNDGSAVRNQNTISADWSVTF